MRVSAEDMAPLSFRIFLLPLKQHEYVPLAVNDL
jgi:hypothetical protein